MRGLGCLALLFVGGCEKLEDLGVTDKLGALASNYVEVEIGSFPFNGNNDPSGSGQLSMTVKLDTGELTCGDIRGSFYIKEVNDGDDDIEWTATGVDSDGLEVVEVVAGSALGLGTLDFGWDGPDGSQTCQLAMDVTITGFPADQKGKMEVEVWIDTNASLTEEEVASIKVTGSVTNGIPTT